MCGIVGYIGIYEAKDQIISGLKKLEYRGYDSAGIGLFNPKLQRYECFKEVGKVSDLEHLIDTVEPSNCGIGHTRWATHGKVTRDNAHPHLSQSGRFMIVHNGVIENHRELRERFFPNYAFLSGTDSEVIVQLIEYFSTDYPTEEALMKTLKLLEGSYAILLVDQTLPQTIYAAKNQSPLLIGTNKQDTYIASDLGAFADQCEHYHALEDHRVVVLNLLGVSVYDYSWNLLNPLYEKIEHSQESVELGHYGHYMLKEIHEQPSVIRRLMSQYCQEQTIAIDKEIIEGLKRADCLYILAAGTSMHAGLVAKKIFETLTSKRVEVHIASEFAYHPPRFSRHPYMIFISQSGETADLRAAMRLIKQNEFPILTITNVKTSTLAREADHYLEIYAGKEVAVASTKAYIAQVAVLAILAATLATERFDVYQELSWVCLSMEDFLARSQSVAALAQTVFTKRNAFYIGRGIDYFVALEAALKLKEVSYIQTEGFAAGELKHGTIALIEKDTPVVALISEETVALNTRSNLEEVISRGAQTMTIVLKRLALPEDTIVLNDVHPLLAPMVLVVPTQLLAYYAALQRGLNIDQPRNLAKSVTVE